MKTLRMAVLLGLLALVGNLTVDWLRHAEPEPVELIGASIIGMVLALGFRTKHSHKAPELVNLEGKDEK
jgi:hypothetical protein